MSKFGLDLLIDDMRKDLYDAATPGLNLSEMYPPLISYWHHYKYKTASLKRDITYIDKYICRGYNKFQLGYYTRLIRGEWCDVHNLPIDYNFDMAKRFYTNPFQEFNTLLLDKIYDEMKRYINSMYGIERKGIPIAKEIKNLISIPRMPIPGETYHLWCARGCTKPFLKPAIITVED